MRIIIPVLSILFTVSCSTPAVDRSQEAAEEITNADKAMNELAAKEGFFKALFLYADSEMVTFGNGQLPVVGKAAYAESLGGKEGPKTLSWYPIRAWGARSGELGYSWGNWKYVKPDTTFYGCYFTAWRKQADGSWKWVIDGGNDTPAPEVKP